MHVSATARRYARSLASVAIEGKIEDRVGEELAGLQGFFAEAPLVRLTLESPDSSREAISGLLDQIESAVDLAPPVRNVTRVLVDEGRFGLFAEVAEGYRQALDRHRGIVEVNVRTAQPLDDASRGALEKTLKDNVTGGRDVRLAVDVDPELLGGAVVRIGSVVYDGSLVNQLNQLRQQLIAE